MIHHLSIAADDPEKVAQIFAELLDGICIPFPPNPGSFMSFAPDGYGTAIEVYPARTVLKPNGPGGALFACETQGSRFAALHFALSLECSLSDIEAIAAREGWPCYVCNRGGDFEVVELWIEGRSMVELLPPDFAVRYVEFANRVAGSPSPSLLMANHVPNVPLERANS